MLLGVVLAGCGEGGLATSEASELVGPVRGQFDQLDRWARRTVGAEAEMRNRETLQETLFAPVQRSSSVWAMWVRAGQDPPLHFGVGDKVPSVGWVRLRDPVLGEIEASVMKLTDPRAGRRGDALGQPCVVIRRVRAAPNGRPIEVTVAFHLEPHS